MLVRQQVGILIGLVALVGCGAHAGTPPAAPPSPPPAAKASFAHAGGTSTFVSGAKIWDEEYSDDGDVLRCHAFVGDGQDLIETFSRVTREVRMNYQGQVLVRQVPPGALVLENGCWQQYSLVARAYPDAAAKAVKVYLPGQDTSADAVLDVHADAGGRAHLKIVIGGLEVQVDVSSAGAVEHAAVPSQNLEVRGGESWTRETKPTTATVASSYDAEPFEMKRGTATLRGEIDLPRTPAGPWPLVILVAGSGPTDRNGDSVLGLHTSAYKQLADALSQAGIATLRFDKRGVGASSPADEEALRFEDYVEDLRAMVAKGRSDRRFGKVVVLGHSEGGVLSVEVAQQTPLDGLVLVACPGRPFVAVLREQLASRLEAGTMAWFDTAVVAIRRGEPAGEAPAQLAPIFRPTVRPYLRSLLDVNPSEMLRTAKAGSIAVIQGDADVQVSLDEDARHLVAADPAARLTVVHGMAHSLKIDPPPSQRSYGDPTMPIAPDLVAAVVKTVKGSSSRNAHADLPR